MDNKDPYTRKGINTDHSVSNLQSVPRVISHSLFDETVRIMSRCQRF